MEELDAIDWYRQCADDAEDETLKGLLLHNSGKRWSMLRCCSNGSGGTMADFERFLKTYLFTEGSILQEEKSRPPRVSVRAGHGTGLPPAISTCASWARAPCCNGPVLYYAATQRTRRFSNSVSSRSVFARRCSRDTATLEAWITRTSTPRTSSQRTSQKPSRLASKATAIRVIVRPTLTASSASDATGQAAVLGSAPASCTAAHLSRPIVGRNLDSRPHIVVIERRCGASRRNG